MAMNWFCSCANTTSKTAKLIRFDGGVEEIKMKSGMGKKVAEIMIDNPNQFVCDLGTIKAGHRILALPAEEEIEGGNTYLLLPFHELRSVVTQTEIAKFHELKKKKCKPIFCHSKIVPISQDGVEIEIEIEIEMEMKSSLPRLVAAEEEIESMKMKIGGQRCWKPSLHTIEETRSFKFTENHAAKRQVLAYRLR